MATAAGPRVIRHDATTINPKAAPAIDLVTVEATEYFTDIAFMKKKPFARVTWHATASVDFNPELPDMPSPSEPSYEVDGIATDVGPYKSAFQKALDARFPGSGYKF